MTDIAPVTGAEAAVAALAASKGDALKGAVTLSICTDDGSVGLYRSDGDKVVEPVASSSFANAGAKLADGLAQALDPAGELSGIELVKSLRSYRAQEGSRHGRALRRLDRSGLDGTCLVLEETEGAQVSASSWVHAYEQVVGPVLDAALKVAGVLSREAGVEGEPLRVVLSGEIVDAQAMLHVRRGLGSEVRLADRRFPQADDDAFDGLVEVGRKLFEAGQVSRDRRMPFALALAMLGDAQEEGSPAEGFVLFDRGDPVSSVCGERWSEPLFAVLGDAFVLRREGEEVRVTVPEEVLGADGCAVVRVAALAKGGRVLLRLRPADVARDEALAETDLTVEGM